MFLISDSFAGETTELSLVQNTGVSCKAWSYFIDTDITGEKRTYGAITVNFPVFASNDVLSGTGKTMKTLDTSAFVECKPSTVPIKDFNLVGGTVKTSFYGTNQNGQSILLKQVDRNISTISKSVLNQKQIIPTGTISGTEINSKLTSSQETFSTKIKVVVDAQFQFKQYNTLVNSGHAVIQASVPIKLYNPVKTPVPSTSSVVDLKSLSQTVFDLKNYKTSSLIVTAKGELPQWKDSEGSPYVKLIDPNNKVVGTFLMSYKKLVNSATSTYEFSTTNLVIPKTPLGVWKVEMHSNNDIRKLASNIPSTDVLILKTYDSSTVTSPIPIPIIQCMKLISGQEICLGDEEFKAGGVCYAKNLQWCVDYHNELISNPHDIPKTELGTASAFIAYKLTFDQGGIAKGIIPQDKSISVDFEPLSFVAVPNKVAEKLQTITLINSIDTSLLGASNISNLVVNTKFNILVDGSDVTGEIQLNSIQLERLGGYTKLRDSYLMNKVMLNSADISKFLSGVELIDGQNITLQSVSDGTFDVTNTSGTHKGSFTGLTFTYDLQYTQDENINPEPCEGLSGEELLACRGANPDNCVDLVDVIGDEHCRYKEGSTGGYCEGLTPTECANKGKNGFTPTDNPICDAFGIGCNPSGEGSDIIECPNGSFTSKDTTGKSICLDNTKRTLVDPLNTITDIASGLDIQLFIIIFLAFLFIVLIIVLVKKRKK